MKYILLVDGYNVIGSWPELSELKSINLEVARKALIEYMIEYQSHTGYEIIIVFDAQYVKSHRNYLNQHKVKIIFTKENETADEYIEQKVIELKNVKTQVIVATSDGTEQRVIFGKGALRVSSRELFFEIQETRKSIQQKMTYLQKKTPKTKLNLDSETLKLLEKWRRGLK